MKNITKFTIAAIVMGFFSPSVEFQPVKTTGSLLSYLPTVTSISLLNEAEARRGGGARRSSAHRGGNRNVHRSKSRNINRNKNRNINRNKNVNRNVNRNRNTNVNVNINNSRHYRGGGHYHRHANFYRGGGYYYGGSYHPVARFTFAMLTAAAIGTIISSSSMNSSCGTYDVGGINYKKCDNTWFKPFYEGGNLQYEAVRSPY